MNYVIYSWVLATVTYLFQPLPLEFANAYYGLEPVFLLTLHAYPGILFSLLSDHHVSVCMPLYNIKHGFIFYAYNMAYCACVVPSRRILATYI